MAEVPTGVTFCCCIFYNFHVGKVADAIITIVENFGYFVKNSNRKLNVIHQSPRIYLLHNVMSCHALSCHILS